MITCKECKHWKHHDKDAVWGDCERHTFTSEGQPMLVDIFITCDRESMFHEVTLETHPDFGCVLGEGSR